MIKCAAIFTCLDPSRLANNCESINPLTINRYFRPAIMYPVNALICITGHVGMQYQHR